MGSSQANRPSSHLTNAAAAILVCCLVTSVIQIGMCSGLGGENRDVLCSGSSTSLFLFLMFVMICGFCTMVLALTPLHAYAHFMETIKVGFSVLHSLNILCLVYTCGATVGLLCQMFYIQINDKWGRKSGYMQQS